MAIRSMFYAMMEKCMFYAVNDEKICYMHILYSNGEMHILCNNRLNSTFRFTSQKSCNRLKKIHLIRVD